MSQHDEDFDAGKRAAARELQPLVDAISEAIFLFNEIGDAVNGGMNLKERDRFLERYPAMAKQLDRLLRISPLRHLIPEPKQEPPPPEDVRGTTKPPRPEPSVPFRKG